MPAPRFFTTALALVVSACPAVFSSPTPFQKRYTLSQPQDLACTGWAGHDKSNSGVRVWQARNNALVELSSEGLGDGEWRLGSNQTAFRAQNNEYQIDDNAAIAAASVFIGGNVQAQVFFVSTDNVLRSFFYNGQYWNQGSDTVGMPQFAGQLSAQAYQVNGEGAWSVYYAQGTGSEVQLMVFRKVGLTGGWVWGGNIVQIPRGTPITATVYSDGNSVTETIFSANHGQWSTSWSNNNPGSTSWTPSDSPFTATNLAATTLPGNQVRVYTSSNDNLKEWSYNNQNWVHETVEFRNSIQSGQAPLCAASQSVNGKTFIYVFERDESGKLAYRLYNGGQGWAKKSVELKV